MTLEELDKLDDEEIMRGYMQSREGYVLSGEESRVSSMDGVMARWISMGFRSAQIR